MTGTTITFVLIALVAVWGVITYNRFIKRKNVVREAWSGIDVQLKRRHNLIPNLIETVKGYARHEIDTLAKLVSMRTGAQDVAERGMQESKVSSAIRNLFAVAEQYPALKANTNFLDLQDNLDEIENQIQHARRFYNGAVRDFNTLCESFPSNLIARFFGFRVAEFFELEDPRSADVPQVRF